MCMYILYNQGLVNGGRGHAPRVHTMAQQNSNQLAGYAKFIRVHCTLSSIAVLYQFTVQMHKRFVYRAHVEGMETTMYSSIFEFRRVCTVHALFPVNKPLI